MNKMPYVLAIDFGTSGCRSAIYNEKLEMLYAAVAEYPLIVLSEKEIEQDADLVMFLFRNYYYSKNPEEKELAECIIAKNRNGEANNFDLGFKGEFTQFRNLEYRVEEA